MTGRMQEAPTPGEIAIDKEDAPHHIVDTAFTLPPHAEVTKGDSAVHAELEDPSNLDPAQEEPLSDQASTVGQQEEGEEVRGNEPDTNRTLSANGRKTSQASGSFSRKSSLLPKAQSRSRSKSAKASSSRDDGGEENNGYPEGLGESLSAQAQEPGAQEDVSAAPPISRRQRSSSTSTKALAGLGLAHLGDRDEGGLAHRRTRRNAAASPSAAGNPLKKEEEAGEEGEDDQDDKMEDDDKAEDDAKTEDGQDFDEEAGADADGDIEGVTRCVCGSEDENVGLMIQCEICKCWQHCVCMGMHTEEDCPDVYYCEQCKPELHIPLLRALGLLPAASKGHKKGGKGSKQSSKESMKELMQARDAVALLAQQNVQRRREGQDVVLVSPTMNTSKRTGEGRRNTSESAHDQEARSNRGTSDVPPSPRGGPPGVDRRSPKRRSTLNSRDSGYGWEPIPPGLLNEDEVWDDVRPKKEDEENSSSSRKRKRTGGGRRDEALSPSPAISPPMGPAELAKRRRMSGSVVASSKAPTTVSSVRGEGRRRSPSEAQEAPVTSVASQGVSTTTTSSNKKVGANNGAAGKVVDKGATPGPTPAVKAKQPNQYTYRKDRLANGVGSTAGNGGAGTTSAGRTVSPTPSPSKSGRKGAAALREGSVMVSQTSTPAPGESRSGGNHKSSNHPGGAWGLPEHLSHLVNFLPTPQPEALTLHLPSTKGLSHPRSNSTKDRDAESASSSRPSPHPFTIVDVSEPPTKVRWPPKRMTMGEMRKRVRNISEYVTNKQLEAVDRGKRMRDLGIEILPPATEAQRTETGHSDDSVNADPDAMEGVEATSGALDAAATSCHKDSSANKEKIPLSMKLMDELTRELIAFQQKFGVPPGSMAVLGSSISCSSIGTGGAAAVTTTATSGTEGATEVAGGQQSNGVAAPVREAKTDVPTVSPGKAERQDTADGMSSSCIAVTAASATA